MRYASKSRKDVADTIGLLNSRFEPGGLSVIRSPKIVWPSVSDLFALVVNYSQIHQGVAGILLQRLKFLLEEIIIRQLIKTVGILENGDIGEPFLQETVDVLFMFLVEYLEMLNNLILIRCLGKISDSERDQY
jgi:hypothetical protein